MSDDWLCPTVALMALAYILWRNIRFLLQGRRYRRMDAQQQAELAEADELWEVYHGRPLPWIQLVVGILVAVGVLAYLICRDLGILGQ